MDWASIAAISGSVSAVALLAFVCYKYGRISVNKELAEANERAALDAAKKKDEISALSDADLDDKLSEWVR